MLSSVGGEWAGPECEGGVVGGRGHVTLVFSTRSGIQREGSDQPSVVYMPHEPAAGVSIPAVQVLLVPYFVGRVSADALTEEASGGAGLALVPRLGSPESVVQPQTVRLPHPARARVCK